MKEFIRCIYLFASCFLLMLFVFGSCTQLNNERSHIQVNESESSLTSKTPVSKKRKQYPSVKVDLETLCVFAASEIDRILNYARRREALDDSRFLLMAEEVHQKIGKEENPAQAKEILLAYLDSPVADKDMERLRLVTNFISKRSSNLQNAKNETELLSSIIETLWRVVYYNMHNTTYNQCFAASRVAYVNGDTLQLKRNKIYRFPTMLFINNNFTHQQYQFQELAPLWINTADLEGTFDSLDLAIETSNGVVSLVTKAKVYVEIIE